MATDRIAEDVTAVGWFTGYVEDGRCYVFTWIESADCCSPEVALADNHGRLPWEDDGALYAVDWCSSDVL
ncbi:hypothetical protein ACLOJK_027654 [Asimina triloba]